jgi:hypothetical protein
MRPLRERIQSLPWEKNKGFIPIGQVPVSIRRELRHPNNRLCDGEFEYELTHRYIWRTPLAVIMGRLDRLMKNVGPALEAMQSLELETDGWRDELPPT